MIKLTINGIPIPDINDNSVYYLDGNNEMHYGYIDEYSVNEFGARFTYVNFDNEWDILFTDDDIGNIIFFNREDILAKKMSVLENHLK
jgi:hypothetical protein